MVVLVSPAIYALWIAFLLSVVFILFAVFWMPESLYKWRTAKPNERDHFDLVLVVMFAVIFPLVGCSATAWIAANLF